MHKDEGITRNMLKPKSTILILSTAFLFCIVLAAAARCGEPAATGAAPEHPTPAFYIYLYGDVDEHLVELTIPYLKEALFDMEFRIVEERLDIPDSAWVEVREKYYAGEILEKLSGIKPDDAIAVIGILDAEMFVGRYPYVRGIANPAIGASLVSLVHLKEQASEYRLKYRLAKEMLHELGHLLGQEHCHSPDYCIMGYSPTLSQLDMKMRFFCPFHKKKIREELIRRGISPDGHRLPEPASGPAAADTPAGEKPDTGGWHSTQSATDTSGAQPLDFIVD